MSTLKSLALAGLSMFFTANSALAAVTCQDLFSDAGLTSVSIERLNQIESQLAASKSVEGRLYAVLIRNKAKEDAGIRRFKRLEFIKGIMIYRALVKKTIAAEYRARAIAGLQAPLRQLNQNLLIMDANGRVLSEEKALVIANALEQLGEQTSRRIERDSVSYRIYGYDVVRAGGDRDRTPIRSEAALVQLGQQIKAINSWIQRDWNNSESPVPLSLLSLLAPP